MLFQLKQFRAAATSALIHTRIYRCYCSSFIAVSAGSLNALVMWQQWTFSVRHLHHQHHHHHHHPRVNETTTQRQLRRLLQTIAETSNTGIETVTDNCYLLQNSLFGLLRMDIDNSSVCIVLNVLFYLLISFIKSSSMDARLCRGPGSSLQLDRSSLCDRSIDRRHLPCLSQVLLTTVPFLHLSLLLPQHWSIHRVDDPSTELVAVIVLHLFIASSSAQHFLGPYPT